MALPVNAMEQEIVEAIIAPPVTATAGAAGVVADGAGGGAVGVAAGAGAGAAAAAAAQKTQKTQKTAATAVTAEGYLADVVVLCGETGSGKSTQVLMLHEERNKHNTLHLVPSTLFPPSFNRYLNFCTSMASAVPMLV